MLTSVSHQYNLHPQFHRECLLTDSTSSEGIKQSPGSHNGVWSQEERIAPLTFLSGFCCFGLRPHAPPTQAPSASFPSTP